MGNVKCTGEVRIRYSSECLQPCVKHVGDSVMFVAALQSLVLGILSELIKLGRKKSTIRF